MFDVLFLWISGLTLFHFSQVLAVLAAVTEVIKQQGGQETETEYFAALVSDVHVYYKNGWTNHATVISLCPYLSPERCIFKYVIFKHFVINMIDDN